MLKDEELLYIYFSIVNTLKYKNIGENEILKNISKLNFLSEWAKLELRRLETTYLLYSCTDIKEWMRMIEMIKDVKQGYENYGFSEAT